VPNQAAIEGEARFLRAFYYYLLLDTFGGVPIATTTELKARGRATRDSTFRFIESELLAVRPNLPKQWGTRPCGGRRSAASRRAPSTRSWRTCI